MRLRRVPRRLRVAAAAALVAAVAATVLIVAGGDDRYRVTAVFDQAFGLVESGRVTAGGVEVGEIERIELGEDGLPRVTMAIDDEFRLRRGATAELRLFSLVGQLNRYVDLRQGEGDELAEGAVIRGRFTARPIEFDELLATLPARTRRSIGMTLARVERSLRGRGPALREALAHSAEALSETAALFEQTAADGAALRTLVADGRRVTEALASDPAELQRAADELAPVLATTAARQTELAQALRLLPEGLRSTRGAFSRLDALVPDLRELVRVARPAARELTPTARELRPTLATARPALAEANALAREAPADLRPLGPLLAELTPNLGTLDSALDFLNPVLDHARTRTPELTSFLALAGDASANYDAVGHGLRIAAILSDVPRRSIGRSEAEPGCLVRPFDRDPGVLEGVPWLEHADSFVGGGQPPESFLEPGEGSPSGGPC